MSKLFSKSSYRLDNSPTVVNSSDSDKTEVIAPAIRCTLMDNLKMNLKNQVSIVNKDIVTFYNRIILDDDEDDDEIHNRLNQYFIAHHCLSVLYNLPTNANYILSTITNIKASGNNKYMVLTLLLFCYNIEYEIKKNDSMIDRLYI